MKVLERSREEMGRNYFRANKSVRKKHEEKNTFKCLDCVLAILYQLLSITTRSLQESIHIVIDVAHEVLMAKGRQHPNNRCPGLFRTDPTNTVNCTSPIQSHPRDI